MMGRTVPWLLVGCLSLGFHSLNIHAQDSAMPAGATKPTTTAQIDKDGSLVLVNHTIEQTAIDPSTPKTQPVFDSQPSYSISLALTPTLAVDWCRAQMGWPTPEYYLPNWESAARHIDSALIGNRMRLRWDVGYDMERYDRAEYYTARNRANFNGRGLAKPETSIDGEDLSLYLESALSSRFSVFLEMSSRYLNPEQNSNAFGVGDLNCGFKLMFAVDETVWRTFQLRLYTPTGDHDRGMGTGHCTLEPALLIFQKLTPHFNLEAELRDWIPINGTLTAGNVLRYGLGLSHDLMHTNNGWLIRPVAEIVGWTVLRGEASSSYPADQLGSSFNIISETNRDTIINGALGIRLGSGSADFYLGYSRALTGPAWFNNAFHCEFRINY